MRTTMRWSGVTLLLCWLATSATAAKLQPITLADCDLLPNGNYLVTDAGRLPMGIDGGVFEIDPSGEIVWSYTEGLLWTHNADRQPDGSTIMSDTNNDRVIIIDRKSTV